MLCEDHGSPTTPLLGARLGFRVWRFRYQGLGLTKEFRVQGLGFEVWDLGCWGLGRRVRRIVYSGLRVQGSRFRVLGLGFVVWVWV